MSKAVRQFRSGFIGIELLIAGLVVLVIAAGLANYAKSPGPDGQKAPAPIPIAGTAQTVTDTVRARAAVIRMAKEVSADTPEATPAPVIDPPVIEPPVVDPDAGEGLIEILQGIFEGL